MPPYRCVFLDSDGAAHGEIELISQDEPAALAVVADVANPNGLELWDGSRFCRRLPPRFPQGAYGGWGPHNRFVLADLLLLIALIAAAIAIADEVFRQLQEAL